MENILTFEPLWTQEEYILRPVNDIKQLRADTLTILLDSKQFCSTPDGIDNITSDILAAVERVLWTSPRSNSIIEHLLVVSRRLSSDPTVIVRSAIALWYTSAVPVIVRDPQQGLPADSEMEVEDGVAILRWNRQYAEEQHHAANLGILAMSLTSDIWQQSQSPSLQHAELATNATVSILYTAYILTSTNVFRNSWQLAASAGKDDKAIKAFIRTAWQIAREGNDTFDCGPGSEFGASQEEVKLSRNSKNLLSRVGREDWCVAPLWHPCRRVPGSAWNKFMRNSNKSFFTPQEEKPTSIRYEIPSSVLSLAEPWHIYYARLRSRFDQTKRARQRLPAKHKEAQFASLASASGNLYPAQSHTEAAAAESLDVDQEYLYNLPMIKRPVADTNGNLTPSFLTSTARALRFEVEPDEAETDFFTMTFTCPVNET